MAKKAEATSIDRCQIIAETSLDLVGPALAALSKLGVENVGYKLITDLLRFKNNKRTAHEVAASVFAMEFIKKHPRFTRDQIVAVFKDAGRGASTVYYVLKKLVRENVLSEVGDEFVRVEALPAPQKAAKAAKKASAAKKHAVSHIDTMLGAMKGRKQIAASDLTSLFKKQKRNPKSVSPLLNKLVTSKRLKALGNGQYLVMTKKKVAKKAKPVAAAAAAQMNGAEAHG